MLLRSEDWNFFVLLLSNRLKVSTVTKLCISQLSYVTRVRLECNSFVALEKIKSGSYVAIEPRWNAVLTLLWKKDRNAVFTLFKNKYVNAPLRCDRTKIGMHILSCKFKYYN